MNWKLWGQKVWGFVWSMVADKHSIEGFEVEVGAICRCPPLKLTFPNGKKKKKRYIGSTLAYYESSEFMKRLWCMSPKHRYFCTKVIDSPLSLFLLQK